MQTGEMHSSNTWRHKWEICTALHRASSVLHQGLTQHMLIHRCVSGAPEDTETLQLEASLLPRHSKSCPKGFLIQTHHFFPAVNSSYTASENSRNSSQQCQHKQAAAPGTLSVHTVLPTLRASVACPKNKPGSTSPC